MYTYYVSHHIQHTLFIQSSSLIVCYVGDFILYITYCDTKCKCILYTSEDSVNVICVSFLDFSSFFYGLIHPIRYLAKYELTIFHLHTHRKINMCLYIIILFIHQNLCIFFLFLLFSCSPFSFSYYSFFSSYYRTKMKKKTKINKKREPSSLRYSFLDILPPSHTLILFTQNLSFSSIIMWFVFADEKNQHQQQNVYETLTQTKRRSVKR